MLSTLVQVLLVFAVGYYLPGRLATNLLVDDVLPEERFPISLATGLLLVNVTAVFVVGVWGLFAAVYMTSGLVLAVSAAWTVALGAWAHRRGRLRLSAFFERPTGRQWALYGLTAVTTLVFAINYDRALLSEDDCAIRAASAIVVEYLRPELVAVPGSEGLTRYQEEALRAFEIDGNPVFVHNQGQRIGPAVLVAPSIALFGTLGLRIAYLLQGLLLPGLGLAFGLRLTSSRWAPWLVAVLLALSPYAMNMYELDENIMSSIFGTLMLVCLVRPRPSWIIAGAALSLFLGIRHVGVVMVPFVLAYIVMVAENRRRALIAFLGALILFALPYLILHANLLLVEGALFEGGLHRPMVPHDFFGLRFELPVLLNFPFTRALYRSPYTALPPLISFPLDFIVRHGLLLCSLLVPGILRLREQTRAHRVLLLGWVLPLWGLVMIQSNWTQAEKMGVPASALAPLVLVLVFGAEWLADRRISAQRRLLGLGAGLLLPAALLVGLRSTPTEMDPRIYDNNPEYLEAFFGQEAVLWHHETPDYLAYERARYRVTWLPDVVPDAMRWGHGGQLVRDLVDDLSKPRFEEWTAQGNDHVRLFMMGREHHIGPFTLARQLAVGAMNSEWLAFRTCDAPPAAETVDVVLDLSTSPTTGSEVFVAAASESPVVDLSSPGWHVFRAAEVPFAAEPMNVSLGRACDGQVIVFLTPRGLDTVRLDLPGLRLTQHPADELRDGRVDVRQPADAPLLLVDFRGVGAEREYQRFGSITGGVIRLGPPRPQ